MATLKRIQLFGKLDRTAYKALESATMLARTRGNPYVELGHWLNQIVLAGSTDVNAVARYFGLNEVRLTEEIIAYLDGLPRGASSIQDFGTGIESAVKEGWSVASLSFNRTMIRTGDLLLAAKRNPQLSNLLHEISSEFRKINADILEDRFDQICSVSDESKESAKVVTDTSVTTSSETASASADGDAISKFTTDMTAKAKKELEAGDARIVGRDEEIRKIIDILLRRRQNNPIVTGEAGVGKTAVVEGFAQRLAMGDVPNKLKGARLLSVDIGLLQAGASVKGEFENRLKSLIECVRNSDVPTLLFIDEAHTLIGAGGAAGQNDAANLLKPALARGELRCIAATTWQEYVKYFEKDPALARRFQNIMVDEPDDKKAVAMLRAMKKSLEKHHGVNILDEALEAAVKLSRRYIPARQLPDKAVSILDTACSRVALSQDSEPAALEKVRRSIENTELAIENAKKEQSVGIDHSEQIQKLSEELESFKAQQISLNKQLSEEKTLYKEITELRTQLLEAEVCTEEEKDVLRKKLNEKRNTLKNFQEDHGMLEPEVSSQSVGEIIAEWTGIPVGRMVKDEINSILGLADLLKTRVIGQDHAMNLIADRIVTSRASLADPNKPIAVLMLAGPSGTGKTETALSLAEALYGLDTNLVTINMSEFQESHTVSTLKGAPPGYVGYGEGGVLTEAVRRKPYSVVLLDEVEKAHPDVHEIFFQVFDKGRMEDGAGRLVNFRNTVILLTTNAGDEEVMRMCEGGKYPSVEELSKAMMPAMRKIFPAALLGRLMVVPYYPLGNETLKHIIDLKLSKIAKRVKENYKAKFVYGDDVRDEILSRCDNIASGARLIDSIVNNHILPGAGKAFLEATMDGRELDSVKISVKEGSFVYDFVYKEA